MTALRAHGYRPSREAEQHIRILETLRFTLALEEARIDLYQFLRSQRHHGLYEGFLQIPESQAAETVREAEWLIKRTKEWLQEYHPELVEQGRS